MVCTLQIGGPILACPEQCLAPYDQATLNRPDIPANVQQLLIVQGSTVWMQEEKYQGEVQQNCVAIAESVIGQIVFILKLQDLFAMPQEQADLIVKLIVEVDHHLPVVVRGKKASTLNGYMKYSMHVGSALVLWWGLWEDKGRARGSCCGQTSAMHHARRGEGITACLPNSHDGHI